MADASPGVRVGSTWVRCRDGALYRDPQLVFDGGFVAFPRGEPELALWMRDAEGKPSPIPLVEYDIAGILEQLFHGDGVLDLKTIAETQERQYPGSDPPVLFPALVIPFRMLGRIPQPQIHHGTARYNRQCYGGQILELPASPRDAYRLGLGE
jgi:hypothetical protein